MIVIGRFSDLSEHKEYILTNLCDDDSIAKCLLSNEEGFINYKIPTDFDRTELIWNCLFPFKYVPDTQTTPKTFITLRLGYKPYQTKYKCGYITFFVITHKSLVRTDNGLRYDFLINRIDELFNSSRGMGLGTLPFYDMDEFIIDSTGNWLGSYITYKTTEFQ